MEEKIFKLIGYAIAAVVIGFIFYVAIAEMQNEQEARRAYQEQLIQQCIDNGGSVEVKSGQLGGWSCHLPNEVLRDE